MKMQLTPEDEFNQIIDNIELRAMADDGPVTPTLKAATEKELSRLWELVNEISPKRKALARKQFKGTATDEEVREFLIQEGLDPDQVAKEGSVFAKAISRYVKTLNALVRISNCNDIATAREYAREAIEKSR